MDVPYTKAMGSIRFSLGRYNTADEVDEVVSALERSVARLVAMGG
jgi:cysteine desulfurase